MEILMSENFSIKEADELRHKCEQLIKDGEINFVFDFRQCKFIDSTGLGVLVSIYKKCRDLGGKVELKSVINENVSKVFSLTRLNEVFNI